MSNPVCTDDFGELVYKTCFPRGVLAWARDVNLLPSPMPRMKTQHVVVDKSLYNESVKAFHALDRNCNTCKHLCRTKGKNKFGELSGSCRESPDGFTFHPDDPMFKGCWKPRS